MSRRQNDPLQQDIPMQAGDWKLVGWTIVTAALFAGVVAWSLLGLGTP